MAREQAGIPSNSALYRITDEEKDHRSALVRLYLSPIRFRIIVVDDLTQFAKTREEADDFIAEFYKQNGYVLPVTEDDFKSFDQRLEDKDKQRQVES